MVEFRFYGVGRRTATFTSRVLNRLIAVNPKTPGSDEVAVHD